MPLSLLQFFLEFGCNAATRHTLSDGGVHIMFVQRQCHLPPITLKSRYLITKFGLWLFLIMGIFRPLTIGPACALEITSHIKYYYVARDSSVTLNCEFVLYSENLGHMDIECYFTSAEPQNGIASLTITDLKLTDSGTYQCKVKKLPEIGIKNFILSVMERPSMPVCYMDGEAVAGEDLRLRCRSSQGTPPMDYRWSKTSGNQKLPHTAVADTIGGDLYLDKITESDTGTYLCTVLNLVGIEECELELSFPPPLTMYYVYVTIAAAIVSVVLVIIIAVIFHRHRKETEEEFSNEILEDELPPHTCAISMICLFMQKTMEKNMTNNDVRNADGEGHEEDKVSVP
uniref:Ig-like domain-containing protein n=1 Tax=Seriola dumerili TaxID=41447 RepID=A0A3B4TQ57_SERDU